MPKYLKTALAAYHGDVSDIKETLLSNASPDEYCDIIVGKVELRETNHNQAYVAHTASRLRLNPIQAAIFSRKKENLEFLLANNTEINYLWEYVYLETLCDGKPDIAFTLANKLGLYDFTFILIMHQIKYTKPGDDYCSISNIITTGIKHGQFSEQQINIIAQAMQGKSREDFFVSLVYTNLLVPIKIFLNNGTSVNSTGYFGASALEVALSLENVDVEIIKLFFSLGVNTKYINPKEPTPLIEYCRSPAMKTLFSELEQANDMRKAELSKQEELGLLQTKDVIQKQVTESAKTPIAETVTAKIPIAEAVPTSTLDCGCCSFRFLWTKRKVATPPEHQVRSEQDFKPEFTMF